jgi:hypothetical protein
MEIELPVSPVVERKEIRRMSHAEQVANPRQSSPQATMQNVGWLLYEC